MALIICYRELQVNPSSTEILVQSRPTIAASFHAERSHL